jgi:hypothetical protein
MSSIPIALTTPPTRLALGSTYGAGSDTSHAREKFVDAVGNLNKAVQQLQQIVGFSTDITNLTTLVDGNLSFGDIDGSPSTASDNMKSIILQGTSPVLVNTNFTLTHNLGKVPNGFVVLRKDQHADFFGDPSTGTWNLTTIEIQCDTTLVSYTILVVG